MILIKEVLVVALVAMTGPLPTRHMDMRVAGSEMPSLPPVGSKPMTPPVGGKIQPLPPVGEAMPGVGGPPPTMVPPGNRGTMPLDGVRPPLE